MRCAKGIIYNTSRVADVFIRPRGSAWQLKFAGFQMDAPRSPWGRNFVTRAVCGFVRVPDVTGSLAADWEHRVHAGSPIFRISSLSPFFGGLDYGLPCGIASFREEEARVKVIQYSSPRC